MVLLTPFHGARIFEDFSANRKAHAMSLISEPATSVSAVAQGVLFNSFDEQANYEAKKAELLKLGMLVEVQPFRPRDRTGDSSGCAPSAAGRSSQAAGQTGAEDGDGESPTVAVLRRQMEHRETISALITTKSAEESRQYSNIIRTLRSEIVRKDVVAEERAQTLEAQLEALRTVLDRRIDSDSDSIINFSEVEQQCKDELFTWREELRRHLDAASQAGEQSLKFIAELSKACTAYAAEQADPRNSVMQRDLAVVKDLLSEAMRVKVTLLQGRLRPVLTAETLSKLRLTYAIQAGHVSEDVLELIADELRAEIDLITADIQTTHAEFIRKAIGAGAVEAATYCPLYNRQEIERLRRDLRGHSNRRIETVTSTKRFHTTVARDEVQKIHQRCAERRDSEERCLREKIVQMTKLVVDQRATTHAMRTHLVAAVNASRPFPSRSGVEISSRPATPVGGRTATADARSIDVPARTKKSSGKPSRQHRPVLSAEQVSSLYGALATERTVVEEVPVEELAAIAKYARTHRSTDGNFIPLMQKGRVASTTAASSLLSAGVRGSKQVSVSAKPFSEQELATLKELRRLRTKVIGK